MITPYFNSYFSLKFISNEIVFPREVVNSIGLERIFSLPICNLQNKKIVDITRADLSASLMVFFDSQEGHSGIILQTAPNLIDVFFGCGEKWQQLTLRPDKIKRNRGHLNTLNRKLACNIKRSKKVSLAFQRRTYEERLKAQLKPVPFNPPAFQEKYRKSQSRCEFS